MNDREQLLAWKAEVQRGPQPLPPTAEEIQAGIVWKAQSARLYYDALIRVGFDKDEALYLTAYADL